MVKKLLRASAVAVSVAAVLAGCTTLRVTSDTNTALARTVQCHTFAWAGSFRGGNDSLRTTVANPVNESRLRAAIEINLRTVGVQPVPGAAGQVPGAPGPGPQAAAGSAPYAGADCLVGYGIGVHSAVEGGYPYGYGYGWGWRYGGPWGWDYPYVYREGIIAVDIYDARSRQALWHASVMQDLIGVTGEKAEQRIQAAVAALFTKYPR
jgi:Domain of unknown function (DUF4136)